MDTAVGLLRNAAQILRHGGSTLHSSPAARLGGASMKNLRRRQALALTAGALASSSLLMPGRAHALAPKPAPLDRPVKLTLGANNVPQVCPFHYIAAEAKPLGVEIELVKFARYADTRTALASGSIDAG